MMVKVLDSESLMVLFGIKMTGLKIKVKMMQTTMYPTMMSMAMMMEWTSVRMMILELTTIRGIMMIR
jgi:hypothetical protein